MIVVPMLEVEDSAGASVTVTVPMSNRIGGVAVTSHDPSRLTTVMFDNGFAEPSISLVRLRI
jgi:hypothetical protein